MAAYTHMPNYDVRNDGAGPYAVFYCDSCGREFRSQPDVIKTATEDIGRQALGGFLRKIPMVGSVAAENVTGEDPRYSYKLTPPQLEKAWVQVQVHLRECPTCQRIVCLSDFDTQAGFCEDDSPRTNEIAESKGAQVGAAMKGLAGAFGLEKAFEGVGKAVETAAQAGSQMARCPKDGTLAAPGTKFCPECGSPMLQPAPGVKCPKCGADTKGAKFCPECGTKVEAAPAAAVCPSCGAQTKGAKFCPECGTKL